MKILVVDDEPKVLSGFLRVLNQVEPNAEVVSFGETQSALAFMSEHTVDVAFLDINLDELSGIDLAERCKALCPTVNIIFVTGYSEYAMDALKLHASGYLMKPVRAKELRGELDSLRYPPSRWNKRVRIQTFGNFEVFVDGKPLPLAYAKSRECLAYLVDRRGARIGYRELASVLWEDRLYDPAVRNYLYQAIHVLISSLKAVDAQDILRKYNKELAINTMMVDCDYYAALEGTGAASFPFTGEYMSQYSWGEPTLALLCEKLKR